MNVARIHATVTDHANGTAGAGLALIVVAVYIGLVAARNQFGPLTAALAVDFQDSNGQTGFLKWAIALIVFAYLTSLSALAPFKGVLWTAAIIGALLQIQSKNPNLLGSISKVFSIPWTFSSSGAAQ
jgi:hypothetical protein